MIRLLAAAAALGLGLSAAAACDFERTASKGVDKTVVASVEKEQAMSLPQTMPPLEPVDKTAVKQPEQAQ